MAELTPRERLLPSLLDRLTDKEPHKLEEFRDQRVASMHALRQSVLRDLDWLLNTVNLESVLSFDDMPELRYTVINFGLRGLSGNTTKDADRIAIQKLIKEAVWAFEPRILHNSLKVTLLDDAELKNKRAMVFQIEGMLWGRPLPEALFLRTELDLELGDVKVMES